MLWLVGLSTTFSTLKILILPLVLSIITLISFSTPNLDLTLPVEAELQMFISYYAYYTYDGYQVQASDDGGETWNMIEPTADDAQQYYMIYNYA